MKRNSGTFQISNSNEFKEKALQWAFSFSPCCVLMNNNYSNHLHYKTEMLIAAGSIKTLRANSPEALNQLQKLIDENHDWLFGCLSYDLKNEIEKLNSTHEDQLNAPTLFFFIPEHLIELKVGNLSIESETNSVEKIFDDINKTTVTEEKISTAPIALQRRTDNETYIQDVTAIKEHILNGDVYELNYCQEFFAEHAEVNMNSLFKQLNKKNPSPFAAWFNCGEIKICCSSPERFLLKESNSLIAQPIKGTAPRGINITDDEVLKQQLQESEKDRAENVMIVDLMRNDIARCSKTGSVEVEELFGVYTYPAVHQLISTVRGNLQNNISFTHILRNTFPMGSMTGAPKIEAMKLIDRYEKTRRGFFSGSIGYIKPNGDFDFNVVIRSLIYNSEKKYLSVHTGGAITADSVASEELKESLLKAEVFVNLMQ